MFKVYVNDGQSDMPNDDVFYIVAKEGLFLKKKLGIMESIAPVDKISILNSVSSAAKLNVRRIPGEQFAKVLAFFKEVYKEHRSEAAVLLFYNEETKKYRIVAPKQEVSGASVDYKRDISIEGLTMLGTIHSHGSMSAFHSGTDKDDEKNFDGLHITIGNVDDPEVSICSSIVANGNRFVVEPQDYVTQLKLTQDIDKVETKQTRKVYRWKEGKLVEDIETSDKFKYTYRKMDKRYVMENDVTTFNKLWLKEVEKKTYQTFNRSGGSVISSGQQGFIWGRHYDPYAWLEQWEAGSRHIPTTPPQCEHVIIGKDGKEEKHIHYNDELTLENDEFNPCDRCIHRDTKIAWAIEKYTTEDDDVDDTACLRDNYVNQEDIYEQTLRHHDDRVSLSDEDYMLSAIRRAEIGDCPEAIKIPDPEKNTIPITEKKEESVLTSMFRKVFGKEK